MKLFKFTSKYKNLSEEDKAQIVKYENAISKLKRREDDESRRLNNLVMCQNDDSITEMKEHSNTEQIIEDLQAMIHDILNGSK